MSDKVRRVDFSPDEYVAGVGGVLRADEQGVYWMVCSLIMSEGSAIPDNERRIASLCLMRPAEARRILKKLVDMGKLACTDDGKLYQKRALSEVERSANRIQSAAENGAKGGRPAKIIEQKQPTAKAPGSETEKLTTNYQPPTTNEEEKVGSPKAPKRRHSYPALFERFWTDYPTDDLMSKAEAGKAFERLEAADQELAIQSITAFRAYCAQHTDYRPVHASRYLSQRRFDGFAKSQQATENRVFVRMGTEQWDQMKRHRGKVSLPITEHEGQRGWWFSKTEVAAAAKAPAAIDWQTAGAS